MRTRYDQLAKDATIAVLSRACHLEAETEVASETQYGDLWCEPDPSKLDELAPFGLLRSLVEIGPCLFEFFHQAPAVDQLLACLRKHFELRARNSGRKPPAPNAPWLWVISAGRPTTVIDGFELRPADHDGWPEGVYMAAPALRLSLVVVGELPRDRTTLALRLFGAGAVLREAVRELIALSPQSPLRRAVLPVVLRLRIDVPREPATRTDEDREFLMDTQELVDAWERETFEKGRRAELARAVLELYEARFGSAPSALRTRIESVADDDTLRSWLKLVALGSVDEIAKTLER